MRTVMRISRSFTIERDLIDYVTATKGERSASERVNEMLNLARKYEQLSKLETEAERFYSSVKDDERRGTRAFQTAAIRSITRD
jgi:hypothetical protein